MNKYTFLEYTIPERMIPDIDSYVKHRVPLGGFLKSVFENDLVGACGKADGENLRNIPAYANFLYNHVPMACWGSREKVKTWLETMKKERGFDAFSGV